MRFYSHWSGSMSSLLQIYDERYFLVCITGNTHPRPQALLFLPLPVFPCVCGGRDRDGQKKGSPVSGLERMAPTVSQGTSQGTAGKIESKPATHREKSADR